MITYRLPRGWNLHLCILFYKNLSQSIYKKSPPHRTTLDFDPTKEMGNLHEFHSIGMYWSVSLDLLIMMQMCQMNVHSKY